MQTCPLAMHGHRWRSEIGPCLGKLALSQGMWQGSADNFLTAPDRGNTSRYPDRFYLPECWTKPISIEAGDIDPHTNHSLRRDASIQSWQVS